MSSKEKIFALLISGVRRLIGKAENPYAQWVRECSWGWHGPS